MSRRRHCTLGPAAEAVYRELTTQHFDPDTGFLACPHDGTCPSCKPLEDELDALAEACMAQGCRSSRCRTDPPRWHHARVSTTPRLSRMRAAYQRRRRR